MIRGRKNIVPLASQTVFDSFFMSRSNVQSVPPMNTCFRFTSAMMRAHRQPASSKGQSFSAPSTQPPIALSASELPDLALSRKLTRGTFYLSETVFVLSPLRNSGCAFFDRLWPIPESLIFWFESNTRALGTVGRSELVTRNIIGVPHSVKASVKISGARNRTLWIGSQTSPVTRRTRR